MENNNESNYEIFLLETPKNFDKSKLKELKFDSKGNILEECILEYSIKKIECENMIKNKVIMFDLNKKYRFKEIDSYVKIFNRVNKPKPNHKNIIVNKRK